MSTNSKIEWTATTWNPIAGCTPVSAGCRNCYAANHARRLAGNPNPKVSEAYEGTARTAGDGRAVFTGKVNLLPERLGQPLRWKKPRRVFVNSMSDLFHEDVPEDFIKEVFTVMAVAQQHTYQILTKRPDRMARILSQWRADDLHDFWYAFSEYTPAPQDWPLPNVWLGTSTEDQAAADERIPHLLRTPAAVRFLSCEPLLGPVDVSAHLRSGRTFHVVADVEGMLRNRHFDALQRDDGTPMTRREAEEELWSLHRQGVRVIKAAGTECLGFDHQEGCPGHQQPRVDWVIIGGESGPGARPCDIEWIRSLVKQCREAGVPAFVKQLGAEPRRRLQRPLSDGYGGDHGPGWTSRLEPLALEDRKGGDPSEWPEDLRVREFPQRSEVAT